MRKGYLTPRCKRGHDLEAKGARAYWASGKSYCVPCQGLRKEQRRRREQEGPPYAFDVLEKKGDEQLCERIRLQAASIRELQERIDQLLLERDVLQVQLAEARAPVRPRLVPKPYHSGISSAKRNRPGAKMNISTLLARIS